MLLWFDIVTGYHSMALTLTKKWSTHVSITDNNIKDW